MVEELQQVRHLLEVRRFGEARLLLADVFSRHPGDPDTHALAAAVALAEEDNRTAGEHVRQALAADPGHELARRMRFELLEDERRYGEAEQEILSLLAERPDSAELLADYAHLMLLAGQLDKSRALIAQSIRRDPEANDARLTAVLVATVSGDRQLAQEELAEVIRDDPGSLATVSTLLVVLIDSKRNREALAVAQELLRASPGDENLTDLVVDLRAETHPLAWPAYPMIRWGWPAAIGTVDRRYRAAQGAAQGGAGRGGAVCLGVDRLRHLLLDLQTDLEALDRLAGSLR